MVLRRPAILVLQIGRLCLELVNSIKIMVEMCNIIVPLLRLIRFFQAVTIRYQERINVIKKNK